MRAPSTGGPFPGRGLGVQTYVVEEKGRWVVYLDVAMEESAKSAKVSGGAQPRGGSDEVPDSEFHVVRRRINDYASEAEAKVAARFISLGAGRDLRKPPSGF